MAHYAHRERGIGQQGLPFGYDQEWYGSTFDSPMDASFDHQPLLNSNDSAAMADFFENPNAPMHSNMMGLDWGVDLRANGGGSGFDPMGGLDHDNHTISNPAMTLGSSSTSTYQTHPAHHRSYSTGQINAHSGSIADHTSNDDMDAAAALNNMFSSGAQNHSHAALNGLASSTWGSINSNGFAMGQVREPAQSPLISPGSESVTSLHRPTSGASLSHQQIQANLTPQMAQQYLWNQAQTHNIPRTAHGSASNSNFDARLFSQTHMHSPHTVYQQNETFHRPNMVRYGSDGSFGSGRYVPPNGITSREHEKGANLNNVPFAAQAAANGLSYLHMPNPAQHVNGLSSGTNGLQQFFSSGSSPQLGSLPATRPGSGHIPQYHPVTPQHPVEDVEHSDIDDEEFESSQPRKRRKSQMDLDDDADYSPYRDAKPASLKRSSKASRVAGYDGSDDEYVFTPASNKRRRSTIIARPPSSSNHSSPNDLLSPGGVPTAGSGRRKSRNSQPRSNLSEEQKRQNHINSEKTRRDLIKNYYDDLDILVPALKGGKSGLSRSDVLTEIVDYVAATLKGNKQLQRDLEGLSASDASAEKVG